MALTAIASFSLLGPTNWTNVAALSVQMNMAEAKAKLSELVARAEAGKEVIIARDGAPQP